MKETAEVLIDGTPLNNASKINELNAFNSSLRERNLGILEAPDDHGYRLVRMTNSNSRSEVLDLAASFGLQVL